MQQMHRRFIARGGPGGKIEDRTRESACLLLEEGSLMLNFDPTPTVTENNAENWLRSWMRPVETCPITPFSTPLALSAAGMPPTANTCARRWVSTLNA